MTTPSSEPIGSVSLSDVQGSLALLAEAIVGEPVSFGAVEDDDLVWPWCASEPGLSGHAAVMLPGVLSTHDRQARNRSLYRALLLHHLVALESDDPDLELSAEVGDRSLFHQVFAIVEDLRVDALTRYRYPGAEGDLDQALAVARDAAHDLSQVDQHELITVVRWCSLGADANDWRLIGADAKLVQIVTGELAVLRVPTAGPADSERVATRLCELMAIGVDPAGRWHTIEELEDITDEPGVVGEEASGASLDATGTPTEVVETDEVLDGQFATDTPDQPAQASADEQPGRLVLDLPRVRSSAAAVNDVRSFVYDEWDYRAGQHRRAWCTVHEERLVGEDHGFIADVRQRHLALRSRIRRTFSQLRPSELVRVYRSTDGDELDIDAAIEAVADRRSGAPADERLHVRRDRAARDVATAFLVDLSASTSSPSVEPEPVVVPHDHDPMDDPMSYGPIWGNPPEREPVRRVIDVAKDAVALMGDALDELGDQHAVYGFSGTGRDGVEFKVGKDFDDAVSPLTWAAIAEMRPLRYTRMGPAIRHAAAKLAAQPARTKLLIVLSDGYPQDVDYGDDRLDREYGMHDTARALSDATETGIDTFCVTIDPAGHDYLRQMCPDHRYLVIDDVESLPEELAKLYLTLSPGHSPLR